MRTKRKKSIVLDLTGSKAPDRQNTPIYTSGWRPLICQHVIRAWFDARVGPKFTGPVEGKFRITGANYRFHEGAIPIVISKLPDRTGLGWSNGMKGYAGGIFTALQCYIEKVLGKFKKGDFKIIFLKIDKID